MKNLILFRSSNKNLKFLGLSPLVFVALLAFFFLGFWVRYQFFLSHGGLAESYLDWARENYYGGITPAYIKGAEDIIHGRPWSILTYPPGYSLFIAIWKLIGIDNLQTIRLAQAAVDCLAVFPIFYVLNHFGVRPIFALFATGIYAIAPLWAFGSVMLLAEALSPSLMAWLLALIVFASRQRQMLLWLATGFAVAFSALIRPDLILLIGLVLMWNLFTAPADRKMQAVMMTLVGFFSLMFLWGGYNRVYHGHWLFTSNSGNYALWAGLGQLPNDFGYFVSDRQAGELLMQKGIVWHSFEAENYWKSAYQNAWREHPGYVFKTIIWRISRIPFDHGSYNEPSPNFKYFDLINIYFTKVGFFVLAISVIPLVRRKYFSLAYIISIPLVYAITSLGLVYYEARYIRYVPLSYIFATAIALNLVYSRLVSLSPLFKKRAVSLGLAAFVIIVIGSYASRNLIMLAAEGNRQILAQELRQTVVAERTKVLANLTNISWTKSPVDVSFETDVNGQLKVKTSRGRTHYQLMTPIKTSNFSGIHVEYDIQVEEGGIALGLLLPDGSRFIFTRRLQNVGEHIGALTVPVKDIESLYLVLMNSREEDGQSRFTVRKLNLYQIP